MGGASDFPRDSQYGPPLPERQSQSLPVKRQEYLRGVVDMGSNGIRFSVSDLSPPTARILPTLYVYRIDISLYDAQFDEKGVRIPIPSVVIEGVVGALLRFKVICSEFGVPSNRIRIIATEATRTALNCAELLKSIRTSTGLSVEMLAKEDEGKIGALGIASGFSQIQGLAMDLGGGSAQISWLISQDGNLRLSPNGAVSFPYGAAALSRKLVELKKGKSEHEADQALEDFREEMAANFVHAFHKLEVPHELVLKAKKEGGFPLYLSGGGFRGWGYLLLYVNQVHGKHYPISIINGFTAQKSQFEDVDELKSVAHAANRIFRISDRRRSQVPAVAFLINVLAKALPHGIKEAHFCQGGVREGILFQELLPSTREQDPLEVATQRFAPQSVDFIYNIINNAIPTPSINGSKRFPESISSHVIRSFVQALYVHSVMSKESASSAALYSTSVGLMATTHGVFHTDRARLSLLLEERYMGEMPPKEVDFKSSLQSLLTREELWWICYLGKVGYILTRIFPAGLVDERKPRAVFSSEWTNHLGKHMNKDGLILTMSIQKVEHDPAKVFKTLQDLVGVIEKVGKRKNWIGGDEGWGMKVHVNVVEEDIL